MIVGLIENLFDAEAGMVDGHSLSSCFETCQRFLNLYKDCLVRRVVLLSDYVSLIRPADLMRKIEERVLSTGYDLAARRRGSNSVAGTFRFPFPRPT